VRAAGCLGSGCTRLTHRLLRQSSAALVAIPEEHWLPTGEALKQIYPDGVGGSPILRNIWPDPLPHLKRVRQIADAPRMRSKECWTIAVRSEPREFRLSHLLDKAAIVPAMGQPEKALPGHELWGAVLQLGGVLARNLFAFSLTQLQALAKLTAQGADITLIR